MNDNWLAKISGEQLLEKASDGSVFFRIEVGQPGTSRANGYYILREIALDRDNRYESIYLQNLSTDLCAKTNSYKRFVDWMVELIGKIEDREVSFQNKRTFYRVVISFGTKVATKVAYNLVGKYFQKYFPLTPILGVVHQNTIHTHVHANLQARNISGKKLHFDNRTYKTLDILWGENNRRKKIPYLQ